MSSVYLSSRQWNWTTECLPYFLTYTNMNLWDKRKPEHLIYCLKHVLKQWHSDYFRYLSRKFLVLWENYGWMCLVSHLLSTIENRGIFRDHVWLWKKKPGYALVAVRSDFLGNKKASNYENWRQQDCKWAFPAQITVLNIIRQYVFGNEKELTRPSRTWRFGIKTSGTQRRYCLLIVTANILSWCNLFSKSCKAKFYYLNSWDPQFDRNIFSKMCYKISVKKKK